MSITNSLADKRIQQEERYQKSDLPNRINQNANVACELAERERMADQTLCAMKKMLPGLLNELAAIKDYRKKNIKHPLTMLLAYGILMFALHYASRREANREMSTPIVRENLKALFPELGTLPHGDTLYRLLENIDVDKIEKSQINLLKKLIAGKKFAPYLMNGKYRIAIDGTQKLAHKGEYGEGYLLRHVGKEKTPQSYVYVLEAVLVLGNGLVIPFMSEFLTNRDIEKETDSAEKQKQDCEIQAFKRLAQRVKETFPRLGMILMMDSLYANGPVFSICRKNHWDYMINFKEGSIPTIYKEAEALMAYTPEDAVEVRWGDRHQTYAYSNELEYEYEIGKTGKKNRVKLNVVRCIEEWWERKADGKIEEKATTYVWLSSKPLTKGNVFRRCTKIARYRWQIENNILVEKHQGYGYSSCYAVNINALKGYHYLSKIAHMVMTLVMMSSEVIDKVLEKGKRGFVSYLKTCLTSNVLELRETRSNRTRYFQIAA
jgi:DDE_Tnp_1-associated